MTTRRRPSQSYARQGKRLHTTCTAVERMSSQSLTNASCSRLSRRRALPRSSADHLGPISPSRASLRCMCRRCVLEIARRSTCFESRDNVYVTSYAGPHARPAKSAKHLMDVTSGVRRVTHMCIAEESLCVNFYNVFMTININ